MANAFQRTIERTPRIGALLLVLSLIGASCSGSDSGTSAQAEDAVTRAAAHQLEQESIRACMAAQGFEYTPADFVAAPEAPSFSSQFFLQDGLVDDLGYRALYKVSALVFGASGAPERPNFAEIATWTEEDRLEHLQLLEAYSAALSGQEFLDSDDSDFSNIGGCRGEGIAATQSVVILDPMPDWATAETSNAIYDRIRATPEYADFTDVWRACMTSAGYDTPSPEIAALQGPLLFEFNSDLNAMAEQEPDRFQAIREIAGPSSGLLDEVWFVEFVRGDPLLSDLYDQEIEQATTDTRCRSEARSSRLEDVIASAEERLTD